MWAHLQVTDYVTIFGIQRLCTIQHLAALTKPKQRAGNQFSQGKKYPFIAGLSLCLGMLDFTINPDTDLILKTCLNKALTINQDLLF